MVTVATKLFTAGNNGNHDNQVGLDCLCTMATKLFTLVNHGNYGNQVANCRANDLKALGTNDLWISFEPSGRFSWNLVGSDAIQGDLGATIFNLIASTNWKWLRFIFQIFSLA
jgi:hypothetical protein